MQAITPFLWFDDNLEEAVNFYVSVFPDSRVVEMNRYPGGGPEHPAPVTTATFVLRDQEFMALNGGPQFHFTEAISFFVKCRDQAEVDAYWEKLLEGGEEQACGWLKDRFGVSWQIIPDALMECLGHPDPERAKRATEAMLQMKKIDVEALRRAVA